MTLRTRLLVSYVAVVVAGLVAGGVFIVGAVERWYTTMYSNALQTQARLVAEAVRPRIAAGESLQSIDASAKQFEWRDGLYVGVRDDHGVKPHLGPAQPPPPPEVLAALHGQSQGAQRWDAFRKEPRLYAASPVRDGERIVGVVHMSAPQVWVHRQLQQIWWSLAGAGLLALVVAAFFGVRIGRSVTRPLRDLTESAQAISRGDFGRQVHVEVGDEIGRLGLAFNRMASQLSDTIAGIRAQRNQLETVLAGIREGVLAVDASGALLLSNQPAVDLLRLRPGAPIEVPSLRAAIDKVVGGRSRGEDWTHQLSDGRVVELSCSPIGGDGGAIAGAVAVLRDVTDLRRSERLRRELVANVSHELRTPLTSIKGFAETLLSGTVDDEHSTRRFLEIIESEANRVVKLVDDLLELSRLEAKGVTFEARPFDLGRVCQVVETKHQPRAEAAGIRLALRTSSQAVVLADPDRVEQILANLVDNALKFTPEGGRIDIDLTVDGGDATVIVRDTGRGIPPDDLPHIFERFYRVDRARARGTGGSGLGLAIARHLTEMQGGRIWAQSAPGQGSQFAVALPLAREDAAPLPTVPHPAPSTMR
jgi:two-component system phosphate regulon sensor histidine kinase PhoR